MINDSYDECSTNFKLLKILITMILTYLPIPMINQLIFSQVINILCGFN